ncbi:hypothetical protein SAMN04487949_1521 [Halogranum gelatinilyticum]|uniref:Lipoprotein n=1 Tax=Halogranum gelatinilyticum TaxID=660521 RepID=A0A1G9SW26_9EURY|nr:hypothetical protein [Halogranum gelatinilyticum]SDM39630.1 hypothetical protein SAMN04487949_1521 [Halogranum gelatinilyticum]
MPSSRRSLLHTIGICSLGLLTGCAGRITSLAAVDDAEARGCDVSDDGEPIRGQSNPVAVEETVVGDDLTYLPDEDAVRYVTGQRVTNGDAVEKGAPAEREPVYETVPFGEWAAVKAAEAAASHVSEFARDVFGRDVGLRASAATRNGKRVVALDLVSTCYADGETRTPSVTLDGVAELTPSAVEVSLSLDSRASERTVPVFVGRRTAVLD